MKPQWYSGRTSGPQRQDKRSLCSHSICGPFYKLLGMSYCNLQALLDLLFDPLVIVNFSGVQVTSNNACKLIYSNLDTLKDVHVQGGRK